MDWNRMRDRIGWALTGVESYEHRQARLSEDSHERILTDLIAELREWAGHEVLNPDTEQRLYRMADRAEARLREVSE